MIFNSGRNDELYGKRCVLDDELLKSPANLAMQDIKWDIEQWRNYMQKAITPWLHESCEKAIATSLHASRYHTSVAWIMLSHIGSMNHAKMLKVPSFRTFQASPGPSGRSRRSETNKHTHLCHGRCSRRHNEIFPAYSGTVRHSKTEVWPVLCGKTECDLRESQI